MANLKNALRMYSNRIMMGSVAYSTNQDDELQVFIDSLPMPEEMNLEGLSKTQKMARLETERNRCFNILKMKFRQHYGDGQQDAFADAKPEVKSTVDGTYSSAEKEDQEERTRAAARATSARLKREWEEKQVML